MKDSKEEISRRELLQRLSPLGRVSLDTAKCTGCGLCTLECLTGALKIMLSEDTGAFRLLFQHGLCLACGMCAEICPEKCLHVERVLELDKIDDQSVLFEDDIARCSRCGAAIGPRVMIEKLKERMKAAGHSLTAQLGLCPECKARTQFGQSGV
jgi:formate hydrogenlyase subunit 6/NADH:ubiquinone oxidoreductase subunit I